MIAGTMTNVAGDPLTRQMSVDERMIRLASATGSAEVAAHSLAAIRAAQAGKTLSDRQREALRVQAELLVADGPRAIEVGDFLRALAQRSAAEGLDRALGEDAAALCKQHLVAALASCSLDHLLDEMVTCTVRYSVGPLEVDNRRIATAVLERMAMLGFARKKHRDGCEIWPRYGLCECPWEVPS